MGITVDDNGYRILKSLVHIWTPKDGMLVADVRTDSASEFTHTIQFDDVGLKQVQFYSDTLLSYQEFRNKVQALTGVKLPEPPSFRSRLEELRVKNGLSVATLCEVTGSHSAHIKALLSGDTTQTSFEVLTRLADTFGVTTDYLLAHDTEKKP